MSETLNVTETNTTVTSYGTESETTESNSSPRLNGTEAETLTQPATSDFQIIDIGNFSVPSIETCKLVQSPREARKFSKSLNYLVLICPNE